MSSDIPLSPLGGDLEWGLGVGTWSGDLDSQMNDLKLTICHCNEAAYLDGGCEASSDH